jgi:hypothetical protein
MKQFSKIILFALGFGFLAVVLSSIPNHPVAAAPAAKPVSLSGQPACVPVDNFFADDGPDGNFFSDPNNKNTQTECGLLTVFTPSAAYTVTHFNWAAASATPHVLLYGNPGDTVVVTLEMIQVSSTAPPTGSARPLYTAVAVLDSSGNAGGQVTFGEDGAVIPPGFALHALEYNATQGFNLQNGMSMRLLGHFN